MLKLINSVLELEGKTIRCVLDINQHEMLALVTTDDCVLLVHAQGRTLHAQKSVTAHSLQLLARQAAAVESKGQCVLDVPL